MANKQIIPIFFAVDDNYAKILSVAIQSIVANASKKYDYHINILCVNLSEKSKKELSYYTKDNFEVRFIEMADKIKNDNMPLRDYYTNTIYFRVYIAKLFPEYDKAIYFDCDVALNGDVSEFYNIDLGNNYIGAITCETVDTTPVLRGYAENYLGCKLPEYLNSGVQLINSKLQRDTLFQERFFDLTTKIDIRMAPDQDYYNLMCRGRVKWIGIEWNKTSRTNMHGDQFMPLEKIKLVHYNLAYRPWKHDNIPYAELWWGHAKNTPVYDQLLALRKSMNDEIAAYDEKWLKELVFLAHRLWFGASESVASRIDRGDIKLMEIPKK